jgi:hypothetical protein
MGWFFSGLADSQGNKQDKFFFFFYSQKMIHNEQNLIELCEKLARQCDELKVSFSKIVQT